MTVRLHIERLVVEGAVVTRAEAARIQEALGAELAARLSATPPGAWSSLAVPAVALEPVRLEPDSDVEQLGRQAAAALFNGLVP